jgi:hypothetical protein
VASKGEIWIEWPNLLRGELAFMNGEHILALGVMDVLMDEK